MPTLAEAKCSRLPYSRVYLDDTEEPVISEGSVEFRLLYEGDLFASANGSAHVKHKHAVRRMFHAQLRRQWMLHPGLRQHAKENDKDPLPGATEEDRVQAGIASISKNWARAGYNCVPMVTKYFPVRCAVDILLLRPGDDKHVACQGDIDGQIKTLFDALRIPDDARETGNAEPLEDEDPFFCLLADDKLISSLRVSAEELLLLPRERTVKASDAFAVITVSIHAKLVGSIGNYW